MTEKFSFSFDGLDELKGDFDNLLSKYPDETEKEVYRLAGVFTKEVNEKMPPSYESDKNGLPKSWHRTREKGTFGGYTVGVEIENRAPHWHLVENGHEVKADPQMYAAYKAGKLDHSKRSKSEHKSRNKSPKLKVLGWAPGKGYCQKTRDEWEGGEFENHVGKFLDKLKRKHNL